MNNNSTRPASDVGEKIEDCVENCTELHSLILDDTEGVTGRPEDCRALASRLAWPLGSTMVTPMEDPPSLSRK